MGPGPISLGRIRAAAHLRASAVAHRIVARHRGVVLLYHRIARPPSDPLSLAVSPVRFEEHLEVVKRMGRAVQLGEMVRLLRRRELPERSISITIDDGYADTFEEALPLLERADLPATSFVATGPIQGRGELWWDRLERMLLRPGTLPALLELRGDGFDYRCDLGGVEVYSGEDAGRHEAWKIVQRDDPTPRHRAFRELHDLCYALDSGVRERLLIQLERVGGARSAGTAQRSLSPVQLARMAADGRVEIGAHSVSHPALDRVAAARQMQEIGESRSFLEEVTGRPVAGLSYPHGRYDGRTLEIVRRLGFMYAAAAHPGAVWRRTDPLRLPRLYVPDEDGEAFGRRLRRWL
jgi:peptidoglycan/xylan/chitin deacetylase (PgdA/CDA1 family)